MATEKTYDIKRKRLKPGPKPKPLDQRQYTVSKPVLRVERSYSNDKRRDVLAYLYNERVYDPCSSMKVRQGMYRHPSDQYREVTYREASIYFKIPKSTITKWWLQRERILGGKVPPNNKQIPTTVGNMPSATAIEDGSLQPSSLADATPPATSIEDSSLQPSPLIGVTPPATSIEDSSLQPSSLAAVTPSATAIEDSSLQPSPLIGVTSPTTSIEDSFLQPSSLAAVTPSATAIEDSSLQPSPLIGVTSPTTSIEESSLQPSPLVGDIDSEADLP
ncbi:MAG: hypothetical protein SEPTF4163_001508 [Sporothrix epigloea]